MDTEKRFVSLINRLRANHYNLNPPTKRMNLNVDSRRIRKEAEREIERSKEEIPGNERRLTRISIEHENRENRET